MPPEVTGVEQSKDDRIVQRSPSEYFPLIRRGFAIEKEAGKEEDQVVMSGWQREVSNRKEREEALREEVNQFESKAQRFTRILEDGIDVTMWQLNRNAGLGPEESSDEFVLKSSAIHVKLHRRGDLLVQAVLSFSTRGGYLSKALGRKKGIYVARCIMSSFSCFPVPLFFFPHPFPALPIPCSRRCVFSGTSADP